MDWTAPRGTFESYFLCSFLAALLEERARGNGGAPRTGPALTWLSLTSARSREPGYIQCQAQRSEELSCSFLLLVSYYLEPKAQPSP